MLELYELTHTWSDIHGRSQGVVADRLKWRIPRGQTVALLGPSGSGKSTLLRLIAGLEVPDQGDILWNEQVITHWPPERRHFALMFQDFALFTHLNVQDNVAFGLREQGQSKQEARRQALIALGAMGLADRAMSDVLSLSGGEQQRVALARAWVTNPELLLLDEPFSALDADRRAQLRLEFKAWFKAHGMTCVLVTHDLADAEAMADHAWRLSEGKLEQLW